MRQRVEKRDPEAGAAEADGFVAEIVELSALRPHPQNYRHHPPEQLRHIEASIRQHGFYRNIVIARDGTILAGHGVVLAARGMGLTRVPVRRLNVDPASATALKVLTADNELGRFAEDDDRALSELLRQVKDDDPLALLGTGYDDAMLAALVMVTRPASEIADKREAAHWVGMPDYQDMDGADVKLIITFDTIEARERFVAEKGVEVIKNARTVWSARWPHVGREDAHSVRFVEQPAPSEPRTRRRKVSA
jgi:hypothetical protein